MGELIEGPSWGFISVAGVAGVWHAELGGELGTDEAEGMRGDKGAGKGLLDSGHVAGRALAGGAVLWMVGVLGNALVIAGAGDEVAGVAVDAKGVAFFGQVRGMFVGVRVVAGRATDVAMGHKGLGEVVALHAVFVGCAIWPVEEVCFAKAGFFEIPDVGEALAGKKADGPIVELTGHRIGFRLALAVALHADVDIADGVEASLIDDIGAGGVGDVFAAGAVTFFTADVPLGDPVWWRCCS